MNVEKTLILAKQDAIHRGLVGEIVKRFEQKGMRLAAMKLLIATQDILEKHYTRDEKMQTETGKRTIENWEKQGKEVKETPLEVGNRIRQWNIEGLKDKPVVAMVFEGFHAVEIGRKIAGHTEPKQALPGTIRGDFSAESYDLADAKKRVIINLIHASGKPHEAEREIKAWFKDSELVEYTKKDFNIIHSFD